MCDSLTSYFGNGSSQGERYQRALAPDYVQVDERELADLLDFAQQYGSMLRYFNEENQIDGDWSDFITEAQIKPILAWLKQVDDGAKTASASVSPKLDPALNRPHLVLFLTFLQLLQQAKVELNQLTGRHLAFYFRQVLHLANRGGKADSVHLLVQLNNGVAQNGVAPTALSVGTLFKTAQQSDGQPVLYRSDTELLANRASIASLKSLFVEKTRIEMPAVRKNPLILADMFPQNKDLAGGGDESDRRLMAMLVMALGQSGPGTALAPYRQEKSSERLMDGALLAELDAFLTHFPSRLYMAFSTFRTLMGLKREVSQIALWSNINATLEAAGKKRKNGFVLAPSEVDNLEKNLLAALGLTNFNTLFSALPGVENIYDLNRCRERENVQDFIRQNLLMSAPDFANMMDQVEQVHMLWRQIYDILRSAGRKKQQKEPSHSVKPFSIRAWHANKFNAMVEATLGTISYASKASIPALPRLESMDDVERELRHLETWFYLNAEDVVLMRAINHGARRSEAWQWDQLYAILHKAYQHKAIAERQHALRTIKEQGAKRFSAMLAAVLASAKDTAKLASGRRFSDLTLEKDADEIHQQCFLEPANFTYLRTVQDKAMNRDKNRANPAVSNQEWEKVIAILETVQRRKNGLSNELPYLEHWENLYARDDASLAQLNRHLAEDGSTPRWRTFGGGHDVPGASAGTIGFAIASPLLALAEGLRTLTVKLTFQEGQTATALQAALNKPSPFCFFLSTAEGMMAVPDVKLSLQGGKQAQMQIVLTIHSQMPAVAPLPGSTSPMLRILLADLPRPLASTAADSAKQGKQARHSKLYQVFARLKLTNIQLQVAVVGLTDLRLQNDVGQPDAKKPFEPFGPAPVAGNSLYFAHPELCSKRLLSLSLRFHWLAAPDNFQQYYLGYQGEEKDDTPTASPFANNSALQASLKLVDKRLPINFGAAPLFQADTTGEPKWHCATLGGEAMSNIYPGWQTISAQPQAEPVVLNWSRYWQLELSNPDFQHQRYSQVAAAWARKTKDGKPNPLAVNPPWTPKLKHFSVNYKAGLELSLGKDAPVSALDRLYHLSPFGMRDLAETGAWDETPFFLPQFENEGELLIGLANLTPPQSLSLLLQLAEGSASPTGTRTPLKWDYLDGNEWKNLDQGQILFDHSDGLRHSGIIALSLPAPSAMRGHTMLTSDLYWLRVRIARDSQSVADIVKIHTQALRATRIVNANNLAGSTLPAHSITALEIPNPAIKAILQPYTSFGGQANELDHAFHTRVSERLRHKNRALSSWDFEHLILEKFPAVYKVKCLPVGSSADPRLANVIRLIVIPDIKGRLPFDPFEPKLPNDILREIEQYLSQKMVQQAKIKVQNPQYVRLMVRLGVRLKGQAIANPGYYQAALVKELQRFLSPWAFDHSGDLSFGGRVESSQLIHFVAQRSYVDYVAGLKMYCAFPGEDFTEYKNAAVLPADAILVSASTHSIDLISEEIYQETFFSGINYMKIGLDFQIADQASAPRSAGAKK